MASTNTHSIQLVRSSNQYLSITDAAQTGLDITGDITISLFINLSQLPSTAGDFFALVSKDDLGTQRSYVFNLTNTDTLQFQFSQDGGTTNRVIVESSSAIVSSSDVGQWVHVAVTASVASGAAGVTLYRNFKPVTTTTVSDAATSIYNGTATFMIGSRDGTNDAFDGYIDDVRVYNTALTANEILTTMDSEISGSTTGLQGYWKLNNDLTDSSPNGNTLTNNNSATFSTDAAFMDRSISFTAASSQYLSITDANQTGLDLTTDFTLGAWINLSSQPTNSVYTIISKYEEVGTNRNYRFDYYDNAGTKNLMLVVNSDGGAGNNVQLSVNQTLNTATWYHVAVVYNLSTGTAEFFVNGSSIGTATGGPTTLANGGAPFEIGRDTTNGNYFDGLIDEVRIFNVARTASQIAADYQSEIPNDTTGLVGYWKLENNYIDSSGNGNTLTPVNSPTFSTDEGWVSTPTASDNAIFFGCNF